MNDSVLEIAKRAGPATRGSIAAVLVVSALLVAQHGSSQSNPSLDPRAASALSGDAETRNI